MADQTPLGFNKARREPPGSHAALPVQTFLHSPELPSMRPGADRRDSGTSLPPLPAFGGFNVVRRGIDTASWCSEIVIYHASMRPRRFARFSGIHPPVGAYAAPVAGSIGLDDAQRERRPSRPGVARAARAVPEIARRRL